MKLLSVILIFCLGTIVYSNSFHCSFHFDDGASIADNSAIKNIADWQGIWHFWPSRFLTNLSLAFNYHFNGLDVFGYHLFNLGTHLVSAILVWWLALLTLSTPALMVEKKVTKSKKALQVPVEHAHFIALFAGLIFVSHPVQTQAVTYIVQRAASLATLFYLASLCLYVKSRLDGGRPYYIFSLITAIAAMFTKEIAISLPLMILLYEFIFLKSKQGFNWKSSSPFLLTLLIIPLTTLSTRTFDLQGMRRVGESATNISSMQYFFTQLRVIVTYIRLVFVPLNQNLDYDYHISNSLFELPTLYGFLFLIIVLFFAIRLFAKYRLISFSIFWFFLALLPESSFWPIKDVIFEHRLYLPLVGYSFFLASGMYYFPRKETFTAILIALTMVVVCNSALSYQRNKIWKDDFTLWNDVVQKSPNKARPYNNLGQIYYDQGNTAQALSDFNKAIELNPGYDMAYKNRASIYDKQGNYHQALSDLNKAIELNPNYAQSYNNRGNVYYEQGSINQAISDLNKAIELNPNYAESYYNRGNSYYRADNFSQALADYNKAIELNPGLAQVYYNRAITYSQLKEYAQAWDDARKAEELGYEVNPAFINVLKHILAREQ